MELLAAIPLFIKIRIIDVVDILLVAIFIYQLYQIIRGTAALNIFFGILSLYVIYLVVDALQMRLLSQILGQFIGVGVLALIVVFQQEIRRFLLLIGSNSLRNRLSFLKRLFPDRFSHLGNDSNMKEIEHALTHLSGSRTGAIMVFQRNSDLKSYQQTGLEIDGKLSSALITNLFFKNNPLHDGAIIIKGNKILAARCILPISEKTDFPESYGLRHRAAAGVTEFSDAVAIVISEQTGKISISYDGKLEINLTPAQATEKLVELMN